MGQAALVVLHLAEQRDHRDQQSGGPQRGQRVGVAAGPRGVRRQGRRDLGRLLAGVVGEGGRLEAGTLEAPVFREGCSGVSTDSSMAGPA